MATKVYGPQDYPSSTENRTPSFYNGWQIGQELSLNAGSDAGTGGWLVCSTRVLGSVKGITVINRNTGKIVKILGKKSLTNTDYVRSYPD